MITRKLLKYDPGLLNAALKAGLQDSIPYYSAQRLAWKLFMRKGFVFMVSNDKIPITQEDLYLLDRIYRYKN